ncbi:MAG: LptF/LptG family permease [Candidatus Omnitrophica bacterium]|nr:LptF/LptG family permease [Candidatus Omnitrophota bacterium]
MRIIDRYILKHTTRGYIFVLIIFIGLFIIVDLFTNLFDFLKAKVSLSSLIAYYIYMIPLIFKLVSPYALLISVLYTFGELNKNNEIISIRVAGISIFRFTLPVMVFSFLISIFTLFIQENLLMKFQSKVENIKIHSFKKNTSAIDKQTDISFSSGNMVFFAQRFLPKENTLNYVTVFIEDKNGNITDKISCDKMVYENKKWICKEAINYKLDQEGKVFDKAKVLPTLEIPLQDTPQEILLKKNILSQFASLKMLRKEMLHLRKIKAYNKFLNAFIEYNQRIVEPFSHLFLVIGIIPFATEIKKRHIGFSALGVGFIFGFIYYCFLYLSIALGKSGLILPFFSAWLVPLFFIIVGFLGMYLIR